MKKFIKRILFIGAISFILIKGSNIYASTSANITTYEINTEEITLDTEIIINMGAMQYSKPSSVYDFIDEDGMYNSVYTSENNVYWTTFDSQINAIKTRKIPMYFDKSNSSDFMKDLVFNFGNALYYNGNLYIVYGREGYTATSDGFWDVTMAIVKYDKAGNQITAGALIIKRYRELFKFLIQLPAQHTAAGKRNAIAGGHHAPVKQRIQNIKSDQKHDIREQLLFRKRFCDLIDNAADQHRCRNVQKDRQKRTNQ